MSKINKTTKLKELKLDYPQVKAWVYEHDIWSPAPGHMPDGYWWDGIKKTRPPFYYLFQRIQSEVGIMEIFNKEKPKHSTICYIREQLNDMRCLVPSISSTEMYAEGLIVAAPTKASKKTDKVGYLEVFEVKRKELVKALVNSKAFAKR